MLLTLRASRLILIALTMAACATTEITAVADGNGHGSGGTEQPDDDDAGSLHATAECVDPPNQTTETSAELDCQVGVVDAITGLNFEALVPGGTIPIGGTGQAGLTAKLAVRIEDPTGVVANGEAIVGAVLTNSLDGEMAQSKPWGAPSPVDCGSDENVCYALPVLVEISHLAKLPEIEGLCVWIEVEIIDSIDATTVLARCNSSGRLDRR